MLNSPKAQQAAFRNSPRQIAAHGYCAGTQEAPRLENLSASHKNNRLCSAPFVSHFIKGFIAALQLDFLISPHSVGTTEQPTISRCFPNSPVTKMSRKASSSSDAYSTTQVHKDWNAAFNRHISDGQNTPVRLSCSCFKNKKRAPPFVIANFKPINVWDILVWRTRWAKSNFFNILLPFARLEPQHALMKALRTYTRAEHYLSVTRQALELHYDV